MKLLQIILTVFVPLLTLIYGLGAYLGWWERISGRKKVVDALKRIESGKNYPVSFIYDDEPIFLPLHNFIAKRTINSDIRKDERQKIYPNCITRGGGGEVCTPMPEGWPEAVFVPRASPVLFLYNYSRTGGSNGIAKWACRIDDIYQWLEARKNFENFIFTIVLINIVSGASQLCKS